MPQLKMASINAEWMTHFFKPKKAEFWIGKSQSKGLGSKPQDVQATCALLAGVIREVDADIVGIQEGPPLLSQMELFVQTHLDGDYEVYSMPHGSQTCHGLVRKGLTLKVEQLRSEHPIYRHLARKLEYYTWGEVKKATLQNFTRRPVVLKLSFADGDVEVMILHTKSKISSLKKKQQYTSRDRPAMIDALKSRQKLSAELSAVRRYVTHAMLSQRAGGVVLMGDLNDGPHRDVLEAQFLIHSIVDELRGAFHREVALMHHTFEQRFLVGKDAFTAEFSDPTRDGKRVKVLLDHIMVSPAIRSGEGPLKLIANSGRIEHQAYDDLVMGRNRHERPSDHRPVSARFKY